MGMNAVIKKENDLLQSGKEDCEETQKVSYAKNTTLDHFIQKLDVFKETSGVE